MALRLANKITRKNFAKLPVRFVSSESVQPEPVVDDEHTSLNQPYKVSGKSSGKQFISFRNEAQLSKETTMKQHMQPRMLPEYFRSKADFSAVNAMNKDDGIPKAGTLPQSKTYRSLTMPLKRSRLANPFPDPVKPMVSDTESDQEKAQRMYSDYQMTVRQNSRS